MDWHEEVIEAELGEVVDCEQCAEKTKLAKEHNPDLIDVDGSSGRGWWAWTGLITWKCPKCGYTNSYEVGDEDVDEDEARMSRHHIYDDYRV